MLDQDKSKQELIEELAEMRRQVAQLRSVVAERDRDRAILSATIECLPFEFFAIGTNGRYVLQNTASRRNAGEAIGRCPKDCAPDEYTLQLWLDNNRRAFAGERVEEEVEAHAGGETRTYYNIISPIREDGKVCGILGVNVDITERKRAEEALRISEEHHRVLKETMLQGVVHHDAQGTIIAMNPAAEHILGKTPEQFLGSSSTGEERGTIREDGSLFPGVEHPAMVALQTGQPVTGVVMGVFNPKVGDYGWISIDAVPLFRPGENRPYQVYAVFEDITARKRTERALRAAHDELEQRVHERTAELAKANENLDIFRKFAEDAEEGFGMSDFDGRILYANPMLCRLFGEEKPEDVIGKNVSTYYSQEYLQRRRAELIPALLRDGHLHIEQTVVPRHGKSIQSLQSAFLIRDECGNPLRIAVVISDITDRKRAEEALAKEHRNLKHMLRSSDNERQLIAYEIHDGLAQQLAAALMQLQAFSHLKDKNPKDAAKAFDAGLTMLQQGHFEARRLIARVRPPILDESGVVEAVAHLVNELRREKGPMIEFLNSVAFDRLEPTLENSIYRIAQEALTNACKHSKSRRIWVSLLQRDDRLRIEIRDWGVGFDPKAVPKGHFGLEGIRQRARLLGGKCSIKSTTGKGTRIMVELAVVARDEEE